MDPIELRGLPDFARTDAALAANAEARAPMPIIRHPVPATATAKPLHPYVSRPTPCPTRSERTSAVSSLRVCTPSFR